MPLMVQVIVYITQPPLPSLLYYMAARVCELALAGTVFMLVQCAGGRSEGPGR